MWETVIWTVFAIIIGLGSGAMYLTPPIYIFARGCFILALIIIVGRLGWWISFEYNGSKIGTVLLAFLIFGIVGLLWSYSMKLVNSRVELCSNQLNKSQNHTLLTPQNQKSAKSTTDQKHQLPPTTEELESLLKEQISFLKRSFEYFDRGYEDEAKRIASSLHILFVASSDTPSLLEQLRIRESLMLPDTAHRDFEGNLAPYHGLVGMVVGKGKSGFIARCLMPPGFNASYQMVPFENWWKTIIINDHKEINYTREQLIIAIAEQDGGIKVASGIDPSYIELSRKIGVGWHIGRRGEQEKPLLGVELHSIRQIGWEALEAFRQQYPKYFAEP